MTSVHSIIQHRTSNSLYTYILPQTLLLRSLEQITRTSPIRHPIPSRIIITHNARGRALSPEERPYMRGGPRPFYRESRAFRPHRAARARTCRSAKLYYNVLEIQARAAAERNIARAAISWGHVIWVWRTRASAASIGHCPSFCYRQVLWAWVYTFREFSRGVLEINCWRLCSLNLVLFLGNVLWGEEFRGLRFRCLDAEFW